MATTLRGDRIDFPVGTSNPGSPTAGEIYYNSTDKRLYTYDGSSWRRISHGEDEGPVFSSEPNSSYTFLPGDSSFNISVSASDPQGFPVTYSYATYPTNQSQFSVSQSGSTFTITPSTNGSNAGTSKLRIKASDGTTVSQVTSTMNLINDNGYANEYIALTGGSIVEVTYTGSGMSLNSTIDAMSHGDALLLPEGSYALTATSQAPPNSQNPFRAKQIAIVGKTLNPKNVVITLTNAGQRDQNIWAEAGGSNVATDYKNHLANLRFIRTDVGTTNYNATLKWFSAGGYARNVIFDFNNKNVAWMYGGGLTPYVTYENCSFLNYNSWLTNYSGTTGSVRVINCAFDSTYNSSATFSGTNQASVSFAATTYAYSSSSSYGHLKDIADTPTISVSSPV